MENNKRVTFKEFIKDYNEYYHEKVVKLKIRDNDIEAVIFDIYDSYDFEIDYDTQIIDIY